MEKLCKLHFRSVLLNNTTPAQDHVKIPLHETALCSSVGSTYNLEIRRYEVQFLVTRFLSLLQAIQIYLNTFFKEEDQFCLFTHTTMFSKRLHKRDYTFCCSFTQNRAARTAEQQSRGKTTRNRVRQLPHSIATSGPAEKHTYIPRCLNNEEIEG